MDRRSTEVGCGGSRILCHAPPIETEVSVMALVRRSTIVGQLGHVAEKVADEASTAVATQVKAAANGVPRQQPAPGSAPAATGEEATTVLSAPSPPAWAVNAEAAAVASKGASLGTVLSAFLLVAIGT